jgi:hypothetical protein
MRSTISAPLWRLASSAMLSHNSRALFATLVDMRTYVCVVSEKNKMYICICSSLRRTGSLPCVFTRVSLA